MADAKFTPGRLACLEDAYDQLAAAVDSVLAHEARIIPHDLRGRIQGLQIARTKSRQLRASAALAKARGEQ